VKYVKDKKYFTIFTQQIIYMINKSHSAKVFMLQNYQNFLFFFPFSFTYYEGQLKERIRADKVV